MREYLILYLELIFECFLILIFVKKIGFEFWIRIGVVMFNCEILYDIELIRNLIWCNNFRLCNRIGFF